MNRSQELENAIIKGRAISIGDLKTALDKSYSKSKVKTGFGDYEVDPDLTTKETQTYVNRKTGQVLVVYRGTQGLRDVFTDIAYTATGYKGGRFQDANKIQKLAENKSGPGFSVSAGLMKYKNLDRIYICINFDLNHMI